MPDLLVVVLTVCGDRVVAGLAEVDRPGRLLREAAVERQDRLAGSRDGDDLAAAVREVLQRLEAGGLSARLLALAVALGADAGPGAAALRTVLGPELADGWGLPATLPVVHGSVAQWSEAGAPIAEAPLVAGAVVAAARAVGAHAHLPRG